jgi:hypothetical protein
MSTPRIRPPQSERELQDLVQAGRPAVLLGAFDHWPILQRQDGLDRLEHLVERIGDEPVTCAVLPAQVDGLLFYKEDGSQEPNYASERRSFRELARVLRAAVESNSPEIHYLQSLSVPDASPALAKELDLPFLPEGLNPDGRPRLWVGRGGNRAALHYDGYHNIACVVAGKKRFVVIPPEHLPDLYLGSMSQTPGGAPVSMVDFRRPDLERFPRYARAMESAEVIDMEPGEALFLPAFWFHYVESTGLNILVNFWWDDLPAARGAAATACFQHALLALRDLPPRRRAIAKLFFDQYVFHVHGDPYSHLPPDRQGWAGRRSPAEDRWLRAEVARSAAALPARPAPPDLGWDRALVAPDALVLRLHRSGKIVARSPSGPELRLDPADFDVLRRFTSPATPAAAFADLSETYEIARDDLEARLTGFLNEGLLVPAGPVADGQPASP